MPFEREERKERRGKEKVGGWRQNRSPHLYVCRCIWADLGPFVCARSAVEEHVAYLQTAAAARSSASARSGTGCVGPTCTRAHAEKHACSLFKVIKEVRDEGGDCSRAAL